MGRSGGECDQNTLYERELIEIYFKEEFLIEDLQLVLYHLSIQTYLKIFVHLEKTVSQSKLQESAYIIFMFYT